MTTTTTTFTALDVAKKALEIAEANPDYVYESPIGVDEFGDQQCRYVHEGKPSCLFGQALVALGADPERLAEYPELHVSGVLENEFGIRQSTTNTLLQVQGAQDTGSPWGSDEVAGSLRTYIRATS